MSSYVKVNTVAILTLLPEIRKKLTAGGSEVSVVPSLVAVAQEHTEVWMDGMRALCTLSADATVWLSTEDASQLMYWRRVCLT